MDGTRAEARDGRIDELHAEAKAAVGYAADTIRQIADRYRLLQHEELAHLQAVTDDLRAGERRTQRPADRPASLDEAAAVAAEAGAEDGRWRALQVDAENLLTAAGQHESELNRLDVALRSLERIWLFLERDDASLINDTAAVASSTELNMRIVEAQESERLRLVREVHDGPAQALSNAIFQLDYVSRVVSEDPAVAAHELDQLGARLRRELGDVREFISQLRPPLLSELGLEGSIADALESFTALTGIPVVNEFAATGEELSDAAQTVVLRIVQEALQNIRKHAAAETVSVASRVDGPDWVLEVRDDGRGFDVGAMAARGRRNFGLQFMRERAELIGARFEVGSRPNGGTIVTLAIPLQKENE
ncbi:MAG TPA: sensor histidine kinase [Candidatus Limnocylindrales bacterium]|nr:sensor histidine kinase [Candidatus Limnocylindrales bacterium]